MWSALLLSGLLQAGAPADWEAARAAAERLEVPTASAATLDAWRARIRPHADEGRWEAIPWLPSFAEGLRRADAEAKPLLFWAMNGHPLGCT